AVRAAGDVPAVPAEDELRVAPPIEEEYGLLALREPVAHFVEQAAAEECFVLLELLPKIDDTNLRQGPVIDSLGHLEPRDPALLRSVVRFEGGRRTAEHDRGVGPPRALD